MKRKFLSRSTHSLKTVPNAGGQEGGERT